VHKYGVCSNATCIAFSFNASYKRTDLQFWSFVQPASKTHWGTRVLKLFLYSAASYTSSQLGLRGWSHESPTNPTWQTAAILNFVKILISPYWIKTFAQNVVQHTTRPGEYALMTKKEPEVKTHDVISRISGTNVGRSQRLPEIFEPNLLYSSRNAQTSRRNMPN